MILTRVVFLDIGFFGCPPNKFGRLCGKIGSNRLGSRMVPLIRFYYHLVWATRQREPLITPTIEPTLYKFLIRKCGDQRSHCYAINGMPDHVHLIVSISHLVAAAVFIKNLKGSSSHFVTSEFGIPFAWQGDYAAFTISERNLEAAMAYVQNQKTHHADGSTFPLFEPPSASQNPD